MARRKSIPSYCLHKPSGQAVAFVDRKTIYLGDYDSPESRQAYGELLSLLAADSLSKSPAKTSGGPVTVADLCLKFVTDELSRFSAAEQYCQRTAIRILRQLFGETPVGKLVLEA